MNYADKIHAYEYFSDKTRKSKWISFEKAYVKNKFKGNFEFVLVDRYNYFLWLTSY